MLAMLSQQAAQLQHRQQQQQQTSNNSGSADRAAVDAEAAQLPSTTTTGTVPAQQHRVPFAIHELLGLAAANHALYQQHQQQLNIKQEQATGALLIPHCFLHPYQRACRCRRRGN